jgi:hypothetical protein
LIIQCDTEKLRKDGLATAGTLALTSKLTLAGSAEVRSVEATTIADLEAQLGALDRPFSTIIIIAHSNEEVIRVGSDKAISWSEFPKLVARFQPRTVVLVGCKAGSMTIASQFFARIESVRDVFGSPVNARRSITKMLVPLLPALTGAPDELRKLINYLRLANFAFANHAIFNHTREEWSGISDKNAPVVEAIDRATPEMIKFVLAWKNGLGK